MASFLYGRNVHSNIMLQREFLNATFDSQLWKMLMFNAVSLKFTQFLIKNNHSIVIPNDVSLSLYSVTMKV